MRSIKVKPLSREAFHVYGDFASMLEPSGHGFDGGAHCFYPDQVLFPVSGCMPLAFSPLTVKKSAEMIVSKAEYHDDTGEAILPLDDDCILHLAPPTGHAIAPEKTEAFLVPKGTLVKIKAGVWHLAPLPVHNEELHAMITLPERVYARDCAVVDYPEDQWIKIEL